jgi:hypothetical protein
VEEEIEKGVEGLMVEGVEGVIVEEVMVEAKGWLGVRQGGRATGNACSVAM